MMGEHRKSSVTIRIYYAFPPKGKETSPGELTWEDVQKYLSGKPLRLGPDRWTEPEEGQEPGRSDANSDADKPTDPGAP